MAYCLLRYPANYWLTITSRYRLLYLWWWGILVVSASLISTTSNAYNNSNFTCPKDYVKGQLTATDYRNIANNLGNTTSLVGTTALAIRLTANDGNGKATITPQTIGGASVFNVNFDLTSPNLTNNINIEFFNKLTSQPLDISNLHISLYDIDTGADTIVGYDWVDKVWIRGNNATLNPAAPNKPTTINGATPEFWGFTNGVNSPLTCLDNSLDERCQLPLQFNTTVNNVNIQYGNKPYGLPMLFLFAKDNPKPQNFALRIDGYCYRPYPVIQIKKTFPNGRFAEQDQFNIPLTQNNTTYTGFNTVTNSLSSVELSTTTTANNYSGNVYLIQPDLPYQLSETIVDTSPNDTYIPNLAYYQPTLSCTNNDTPMTTVLEQSFTPTYGDNFVCTITNKRNHVFSGIVFNDNGGITTANPFDTSSTYLDNLNYFDGVYQPTIESGIGEGSVQLTNCDATNPTILATQAVTTTGTDRGKYEIIVTQAQLAGLTKVCLVEIEGDNFSYPVDTTANTIQIPLVSNTYAYPNNNFGEVSQHNAALVLIKEQVVNGCDVADLTTLTYRQDAVSNVNPGQCIAYKITATNRGHVALSDIVIQDRLQLKGVFPTADAPVTSTLHTPIPTGIATAADSVAVGSNGMVKTVGFGLPVQNTANDHIDMLYFNTKYGSTLNP